MQFSLIKQAKSACLIEFISIFAMSNKNKSYYDVTKLKLMSKYI